MTGSGFVIETARLRIRTATPDDADHYLRLWSSAEVMRHVGFPRGLRLQLEDVVMQIHEQGDHIYDQLLVVELAATAEPIGECRLHRPDASGVASTDVKLLPDYWGHGYGVEVKQTLVEYLFTHTDCDSVQGTPAVTNAASIRMQEAVGAVRVGEAVHEFTEPQRQETCPVHHFIYRVSRSRWETMRGDRAEEPAP